MSTTERIVRHQMRQIDSRLGSANFLRRTFNKAFPDHWSFMLGEIALYSFIILLLTGTFLTFWFHPNAREVVYNGSYVPLRGLKMSDAYASTLNISFDVRAGLLLRQIHHWSALLFLASIVVHLCRIFFTGAFRRPREMNWVIGTVLLTLGIVEGFAGYSLPDDLLSGTGIRIGYSMIESVPLVGSYLGFWIWGGPSPAGEAFMPRLFIAHVFLIPGLLLALISAHMMIIWHQKHTDFPGPGKTERNVVGSPLWPAYALKGGAYFFLTFAVTAALGAFAQINPIWLYGPYDVAKVSAGSQPDWYMGFLEGSLRTMPPWEWNIFGHTIPFNLLIPGLILPGLLFTLLGLYPFLEQWATKDRAHHHLLERPRNRPTRTAIGVMSLTFYGVLMAAGGNDLIAVTFHISLNATTWIFRTLLLVAPPIAFYFTRRICLGLQHADEELVHHGVESGIIKRLPSGEFIELTTPLPEPRRSYLLGPEALREYDERVLEQAEGGNGHGMRPRRSLLGSAQRAMSDFFFERRVRNEPPGEEAEEAPPTVTHPR